MGFLHFLMKGEGGDIHRGLCSRVHGSSVGRHLDAAKLPPL